MQLKIKNECIEILTRKQSNCLIWRDMRCGRITASKVYDVLHNRYAWLIESICKESTISDTNIPV